MALDEFGITPELAKEMFRADAKVFILGNKEAQLIGKVEVGFVVGRRGKKNAAAFVLVDVFLDRPVARALAVSEVVTLINEDDLVAPHIGQFARNAGDGHDAGDQAVFGNIVLPHFDEVFRTNDEGLCKLVVLKNLG